jgi:hypothetical protein
MHVPNQEMAGEMSDRKIGQVSLDEMAATDMPSNDYKLA